MKVEQFIDLMDYPEKLDEAHFPAIEKIITDYPYFQTAHLLYAKALNNVKHINYYSALKRTAVIAGNRAVLYRLINSKQKAVINELLTETPKTEIKTAEPVAENKLLEQKVETNVSP